MADIDRMYRTDYIRVWGSFVDDLRLVPTATLTASADLASALGRADSPLKGVLRRVVQEVSVGDDRAMDPRFDPLRQFVGGASSPLDASLTLLGKLGAHLSGVDDAINRQAAPPPPSDVLRELAMAAQRAPEPVHEMLAQLVQTSAGQSFKALREPMGRQLADVSADCTRWTAGRYPLVRTGTEEISREDFSRTFAVGGLLDGFFQRNLAQYVDTSARSWSFWRADGTRGEPGESLTQFQRGQSIRQAFFHDGGRTLGASLEFRLLDLDPAAKAFTLDVDGQSLRFARDQKNVQRAQYPGASGAVGQVRLQMTSTAGNASDFVFDGPWALFRLLDRVRVEPGATPDRVQLTFDVEGRKARLEVRSETPVNPLSRQDLEQFECPRRL